MSNLMNIDIDKLGSRIAEVREKCCDNNNRLFAKILGVSESTATLICQGKSYCYFYVQHILYMFPEVNAAWLKEGRGPHFRNADEEGNPAPRDYTHDYIAHLLRQLMEKDVQLADLQAKMSEGK